MTSWDSQDAVDQDERWQDGATGLPWCGVLVFSINRSLLDSSSLLPLCSLPSARYREGGWADVPSRRGSTHRVTRGGTDL